MLLKEFALCHFFCTPLRCGIFVVFFYYPKPKLQTPECMDHWRLGMRQLTPNEYKIVGFSLGSKKKYPVSYTQLQV